MRALVRAATFQSENRGLFMELMEIGAVGAAGLLAVVLVSHLLRERLRRRKLLGVLHYETRGLCSEAVCLAEALCRDQAEGRPIDPFFVQRWGLSTPQTYPGLVSDLWRLPPLLAVRLIEFHAQLSVARRRWSAWSEGDRDDASTYLLLAALVHSANNADYFLLHAERLLRYPRRKYESPPLASRRIEAFELANSGLSDAGYWSL